MMSSNGLGNGKKRRTKMSRNKKRIIKDSDKETVNGEKRVLKFEYTI